MFDKIIQSSDFESILAAKCDARDSRKAIFIELTARTSLYKFFTSRPRLDGLYQNLIRPRRILLSIYLPKKELFLSRPNQNGRKWKATASAGNGWETCRYPRPSPRRTVGTFISDLWPFVVFHFYTTARNNIGTRESRSFDFSSDILGCNSSEWELLKI